MVSKSDELWSWASVPAEKNATGFANVWYVIWSRAPKAPASPPIPMPIAMMPTCSMLEYASNRLRFHWITMNGTATSTESRPRASSRPPENSGPMAAREIRWTLRTQ